MKTYGPDSFGKLNADDYDELHDPGTTDEAVATLAELCGAGEVLEFAIGTGRVALPLAARGIKIEGIDASPEMIAKLREKPGGQQIPVTIANMADFSLGKTFDFAFLIFNTLFNLTTQDDQKRCFQTAAAHLKPGGAFLIEAFVPDLSRYPGNQSVRVRSVTENGVTLETAIHDPVRQVVEHQYVRLGSTGTRLIPLPMRYAWPSEIDLMAELAGFKLECRWADWERRPFTGDSTMHVSLYRLRR